MSRRVTYLSVLERIASYLGEADGLSTEDKALAESRINLCFRLGYEHYFHPDITAIEERTFRPLYDAAENVAAPTATAAVERYYPPTDSYYQTLVAQSPAAQAPATGSGGSYEENSAYWAACAASYSGDDHADATAYSVGTIVRNPANRRYYQCHTAHTSASATLDATKFGILTPFVRSLDYAQAGETEIGECKFIWDADPRYGFARRMNLGRGPDFWTRQDYLQVLGTANVVYPEFRPPCPVFSGATRSDTATYSAGDQKYDSATGDYWIALESISAGQSPTTHPAKWERVVFPYYLAEYVAQSAYVLLTNREQEQPENFTVQMTAGYPLLLVELEKLERQQGQSRQMNVCN
jgi:hypothetical protein